MMSKLIICLLSMLIFIGCSTNTVDDGSGTGTGNPIIIGYILSDDGAAFVNAEVKLRPTNYYSDDSLSYVSQNEFYRIKNVTTDQSAGFVIDSIDTGSYIIEVTGFNNKSVLFACEVTYPFDTIILDYSPVLENDTLKGIAKVYGGEDSEKCVFVEGLERKAYTADGVFSLIVPTGTYNLKAKTNDGEIGIIKEAKSYSDAVTVNVLAKNPISNSLVCDTLIVRAILDSNGISRSALAHAFIYNDDDGGSFVYQVDIEDPEFYTLPAIIGGMRNLRELEIQFGNLSSIPPEIGLLTKITELELNDNKLTSLPIEITNLAPIYELNLSGNDFDNLPQSVINWGNTYNALW